MLTDVSESIDIAADIERVWTVLTTEELVREWLGCLQFRPEPGSTFYMQPDPGKRAAGDITGATHCELEELDRLKLMRFSWFIPGTPKTHVTLELHALSLEETRVRLTHSGWDQFNEEEIRGLRDMLAGGWKSFVLPNLKRVAESSHD